MRPAHRRWISALPLLAGLLAALLVAPLACGPSDDDPPPGSLGGPCHPNNTCDHGLVCHAGLCVEPLPCTPQATQPCVCADQSAGTQVCEANGQWSACVCSGCGDGVIDPGELCDGASLGTATCTTQTGLPYGAVTCTADCQGFDTSACHGCGNGLLDPGELCDGANVGVETCATQSGAPFGTLACTGDCLEFDTSACHACGNGVLDAGELCDGTDVGAETCATQSTAPFGTLDCTAGCQGFDTSACHTCGDGVMQTGEQCDGADLGGESCTGLGLGPGPLVCAADCTLDPAGCGPPPLAETLERCTLDGDCAAGLHCRTLTKGGTARCVAACTTTAQCPSGLRCQDDGSGATYCLGSDIGKACTQASQCNYACLTNNAYCTLPCADGFDCPNGYGCMPVGTPAQNVCVRAEAYCDSGNTSACIAPSACDLSATMILGGCTTVCTTAADCPQRAIPQAPWTCDTGGICRRPGDVYGPLQGGYTPTEWHCDGALNPVVLCNDAQHMNFAQFTVPAPPAVNCQSQFTTLGPTGDACVNSCRNQGGCAFGFACVAVGGISGQRVGLCLPTGALETGAGCTSDPQCVSGYCHNSVCSRDCTFDGLCPGGLTCTAGGAPAVEGQAFQRCE